MTPGGKLGAWVGVATDKSQRLEDGVDIFKGTIRPSILTSTPVGTVDAPISMKNSAPVHIVREVN